MFSLAPALQAARRDVGAAIRPARSTTHDRSRVRAQRTLVVGQLAVSVVMLTGAGLLVRGFVHLVSTDTGFSPARVMLTRLPLPAERYQTDDRIDAFYSALLERLASTPGVEGTALATAPPLAGANDTVVYRQGHPPATARDRRFVQVRWIQGTISTLGIPLVRAEPSTNAPIAGAPDVVIVSGRMARDHFGTEDVAGQHLVIDVGQPITAEVIGVAGDVRVFGQANEAPLMIYLHARQHPAAYMQVIVKRARTTGEAAAAIRRHVHALDPALAVGRIDAMESLLADSVAQPRFSMLLIGAFAGLALLLTLVGLYGTLAYLVAQRRREIGIRLAVGATPREVRRMVLRQGAALIAIGIPLGLAASMFTSRFASTLVVGGRSADPLLHAASAALLALAAFAAMFVPANRAARIEPLVVLQGE